MDSVLVAAMTGRELLQLPAHIVQVHKRGIFISYRKD